jgi:catechol 2,3-dioxygenase-like lactoylglutathione lyase family enzyme
VLHHLSLGCRDIDAAIRFYDPVMAALGFARVWSVLGPGERPQVGYGHPGTDDDKLAIKQVEEPIPHHPGFHLAFAASTPGAVQAFHAAALAAGGACDGPPGLRPQYGDGYFAAFVRDPDGHRLEAVCRVAAAPP